MMSHELKVEQVKKYLSAFKSVSKDMKKPWEYNNREFDLRDDKQLKELYRAFCKKELSWMYGRDKKKPDEFINKFVRWEEDGEKLVTVHIFKNEEGIIEKIKSHMDWEADENHYDYSPTGLWFKDEAIFHEYKERVVVTQVTRLDC